MFRHIVVEVCCALLVLILLRLPAHATTYYLAPTGENAAAGTAAGAAWKTFAYALPRLAPGDTLFLLDGAYTNADSGMAQVACGTNAVSGTAALPITVKALHERQALIQGDGTLFPLAVTNCSYWIFEGLSLASADNPVNNNLDGSVVYAKNGDHLIIRRLIMSNNNRYFNGHALTFDANNSLIEENEIYSVHRHGIGLSGDAHDNVLRRNYLNSRGYADLVDGRYSQDTTRGDTGITCYPCHSTIFENNIAEGWWASYDIQATNNASNNRYLGNISLNSGYGALIASRDDNGNNLNGMPQNTQVTNFLALGADRGPAFYARSSKNTHCDNCTFINLAAASSSKAVMADINSGEGVGDGLPTIYGSNILIWETTGAAIILQSQVAWGMDYVRVFVNGLTFDPPQTDARYTHLTFGDPQLGACRVFIPATSTVKGAGLAGADIGANILYRYQDGTLTTRPLWNTTTGAFPCGAIVAGVNDLAGASCFDVHQRLNVNVNGCTFPPGYGLGALPTPTHLRLVTVP